MHIAIATPMYGGNCKGAYMHSVLPLSYALASRGDSVSYPIVYNESIITRARDSLVHEMLDSGADGILFVDADTSFDPLAVLDMIDSGKDVIGAIYPKKSINWNLVREAVLAGETDLAKYSGYFIGRSIPQGVGIKLDEPVAVDGVGTGLMYISRRVFEEMAPSCKTYKDVTTKNGQTIVRDITQFFDMQFNEHGELLGEDYYFCEKWKQMGGEVYAAPWVNTAHHGDYAFSGSFAEVLLLNNKPSK